jgi:hypothetical protein
VRGARSTVRPTIDVDVDVDLEVAARVARRDGSQAATPPWYEHVPERCRE